MALRTPLAIFAAAVVASLAMPTAHEVKSRRLPAVMTMTNLPEAGSLSPISGRIVGLDNPANYQVCIYLESTASGQNLYNGPKPHEDEGSKSPVLADGTFNYVNWWANDLYDMEAAYIYVVVVATNYNGGNCDPVVGVPVAPETLPLYQNAVVWAKFPRVNNIQMTLDARMPLLGAETAITGSVTGLPDTADKYKAMLYRREANGHLTGPLPGCTADAGAVLTADGTVAGAANFSITNWAGATPADVTLNTNAVNLVVILTPAVAAPIPGTPQCVNDAEASISAEGQALRIPPGVLGPRLVSAEMTRVTAYPSASPSAMPSTEVININPSGDPVPLPSTGATRQPEVKGANGASGSALSAVFASVLCIAAAMLSR